MQVTEEDKRHERILQLIKEKKISEEQGNQYLLDFAFGEMKFAPNTSMSLLPTNPQRDQPEKLCKECSSFLTTFKEGLVCEDCGYVATLSPIATDIFSNIEYQKGEEGSKVPVEKWPYEKVIMPGFSRYLPKSHFNEVVAQRQGEGGEVGYDIINAVKAEYEKDRKELTEENVTEERTLWYLKKTGYNTYYEHVIQINAFLLKKSIVWASPEEKIALCQMFEQALFAWNAAPDEIRMIGRKPGQAKRTSFPNYHDFLKRCCIYLGWDHLADTLTSLKTPHKRDEADQIWEYFGKYNSWPAYQIAFLGKMKKSMSHWDRFSE